MTAPVECLWYIPNVVSGGHRGDRPDETKSSLDALTDQALALERYGWKGALIGTGWGRPDTFTIATALAARTRRFEPLIAVRPGYWSPAHFASSAATLDRLSGGRVRINIVSGLENLAAYGDAEGDQAARYDRTSEFMRLVRQLWTQTDVTFQGRYFNVAGSTVEPRIETSEGRPHPPLYFGGASEAAERVSASQADVQLFWGEQREGVAARIEKLRGLGRTLDRDLPPLEFGLRITTLIRDTSEEAWAVAQAKVAEMAKASGAGWDDHRQSGSVGQSRLRALAAKGDVLDDNLYVAPARYGAAGAGSSWLVGTAREVADSLKKYRDLGVTKFILSDTPYLAEIERQGEQLLPLLREQGW